MSGSINEDLAVIATIDPDVYVASTENTDEIDMSIFDEMMFTVMTGTLGASATIDFKVQESATSGGSFSDISGRAITQLTQAGSDSDKQAVLRVRKGHLSEGKQFIRGVLTIAVATSDVGVIGHGRKSNYAPATDDDLVSVAEIVS